MNILVADDNASVRKVLGAMLVAWGYTVVTATDGREAWDILQREDSPRFAILDWMMPEIDGIDVCRNLRSLNSTFPHYVILLTCRGQKEDIVAGLEAGADDYVTKPFESEELKARVEVGRRYIELQNNLRDRMYELQRQERELRRSNRALLLLNKCSHLLTTEDSEENLVQNICNEIVITAGYKYAWVGISEAPSSLRLIPLAQSGFDKSSAEIIRFAWNELDPSRALTGKAMLSGRPVITRDIQKSMPFVNRNEPHAPGFSSLISVPFNSSPDIQGTLNIYAKEPDAFDNEEIKLLAMLAQSISYGMKSIRTAKERRQFEKELKKERDQAQLYLEVAAVLLVALDRNGIITLVNPKGCSILGAGREEIIGRNWFTNFVNPDSRNELALDYMRLMESGSGFEEYFERKIITKGLKERVLAVHASLLLDSENRRIGMLFSGEDITEKKISEKALKTSEENYRTLFDRMVSANTAIAAYRSGSEDGQN